MNNKMTKRIVAAAVAASLALTPAVGFAPANIAYAADTITSAKLAKVSNVKYEVVVSEGAGCVKFTWDKTEGANHYTWRYNTKYDSKKPTDNRYVEEEGDSDDNSLTIPVGDDYNDIWFSVAAMKDSTKGDYSEAVVITKDTVTKGVDAVKTEAKDALEKKAKSLAKKYKNEGYANVTYGMYDVENNGNELMFYAYNGMRSGVTVFAYDSASKKVVKALGEKGGITGIFAKNGKVYYCQSNSAADGQVLVYTFDSQSNKMKLDTKYKFNYSTKKFTKNGKKISKKAFEKFEKKIAKYDAVDYSANEL